LFELPRKYDVVTESECKRAFEINVLICNNNKNIIIITIIIIIISFMRGTCTHIPETNFVSREYSVAAILLFLFMVLISLVSVLNLLYFYISTFRSMCAVPNMSVFCSYLTSWFPAMLLTYFLNDFEIVPVASIITGITLAFTFHMHCIAIVMSLCFRISSLLL
jgi:magnesium-transporting ATPase (P-type)